MIKLIAKWWRIFHIQWILARNGFDRALFSLALFAPLRFLLYLNPWNWLPRKDFSRGVAFRRSLEELGPIFVKFGQALSTRQDLLPPDIILELSKLQDKVPPFPGEVAEKLIAEALSLSLSDAFMTFETRPLASASIAQVHAAKLHTGESVVVKVLRPNVRKAIAKDVTLMYTAARFLERYWSDGKRLKPIEVVAEFEKNIIDELDLMREAANASQLRRNFEHAKELYVPEIYWPYVRENVMVMERIHGIPITDTNALNNHNVNIQKLAERGVEIFFTQVFRDRFFHADMHPGNIFVSTENPSDPQYISVDFGIMGSLGEADQRYLAENFLAFFKRDYRRVATLHLESGWIPPDTRLDEFEAAIRTVSEPIFERPLKEISFGQMLLRLFQTGRRFNMEVQPQLILLQKTLLSVEGLGRHLYPDLNLWQTAKPFLESWLKERIGPRAFFKQLHAEAPNWGRQLPLLPHLIYDVLKQSQNTLRWHGFENKNSLKKASPPKVTRRGFGLVGLGLGLILGAGLMWFNDYLALAKISYTELAVGLGLMGGLFMLLGSKRVSG